MHYKDFRECKFSNNVFMITSLERKHKLNGKYFELESTVRKI